LCGVELRYPPPLGTRLSPDIVEDPDTGKYGVMADFGVGVDGQPQGFQAIGRRGESIEYWDGEGAAE
jgi:hypothetical protein